ncbi:MAG TPA: hypothetical protein VJ859_09445 [Allosphingosinicella sp.]|nr:hypothetical protein [Allosphingosinicella sp.]
MRYTMSGRAASVISAALAILLALAMQLNAAGNSRAESRQPALQSWRR